MPIYEYRCPSCGHEFEKMVKLSDPIPPCPSCAHAEVVKKVSASSFVLKGGGWYKDHYGLKSGGKASGGASEGGGSSDSGGSSGGGGSSEGGGSKAASGGDA